MYRNPSSGLKNMTKNLKIVQDRGRLAQIVNKLMKYFCVLFFFRHWSQLCLTIIMTFMWIYYSRCIHLVITKVLCVALPTIFILTILIWTILVLRYGWFIFCDMIYMFILWHGFKRRRNRKSREQYYMHFLNTNNWYGIIDSFFSRNWTKYSKKKKTTEDTFKREQTLTHIHRRKHVVRILFK